MDWVSVAAWVQAVGSLLAIAATWLVATRQDRDRIAREDRAARARIAASLAILGACDECLGRAVTKMRLGKKPETRSKGFSGVNVEATADDFAACIERLASIPLFDLPDEKLVAVVVHVRLLMDIGKRRVGMVREELASGQAPNRNFAELQQQLRQCLEAAGHTVVQPRKAINQALG